MTWLGNQLARSSLNAMRMCRNLKVVLHPNSCIGPFSDATCQSSDFCQSVPGFAVNEIRALQFSQIHSREQPLSIFTMSTLQYLDEEGTVRFTFVPWKVLNEWLSVYNDNPHTGQTKKEGINRGQVLEELEARRKAQWHRVARSRFRWA